MLSVVILDANILWVMEQSGSWLALKGVARTFSAVQPQRLNLTHIVDIVEEKLEPEQARSSSGAYHEVHSFAKAVSAVRWGSLSAQVNHGENFTLIDYVARGTSNQPLARRTASRSRYDMRSIM